MNQLCVPIPAASDTQQILDEVFALCRIPWIYDFIFRADPAADISMLLAPIQRRHGLCARIFVNATETSARYAHSFDFNKELMFYSIPAFSVDHVTAGFCVEQPAVRTADTSPNANPAHSLQCLRFVRDDTKGVFLHVAENPVTGITEVDCLTHRSSTRRNRVRMKFDLHSLRSVLRTARGILHPPDIANSLIYLNVSDERRSCPVCSGQNASECDCELPLRRPAHPLDFRFETSNMRLYTGFYQGATVVRLCSAGHCVINATLQSGSVIQGDLSGDIIEKMHRLALTDRLSRVKERPKKSVVPVMPALPADVTGYTEDAHEVVVAMGKAARRKDDVGSEGDGENGGGNNRGASKQQGGALLGSMKNGGGRAITMGDDGLAVLQDEIGTRRDGAESDDGGELVDTDAFFTSEVNAGNDDFAECSVLMDADDVLGEMRREGLDDVHHALGDTISSAFTGPQTKRVKGSEDVRALAISSVDDIDAREIAKRVTGDHGGSVSDAIQANDVGGRRDDDGMMGGTRRGERQLVLSVDGGDGGSSSESRAGSSMSGCRDGGDAVDDDSKDEDVEMRDDDTEKTGTRRSRCDNNGREKGGESRPTNSALTEAEKTEIRKKRNREAAARSNLKRKLKNESVRRDLASLTQRAIRLRVKEMMLRDENTRLRNALRAAKITFLPGG